MKGKTAVIKEGVSNHYTIYGICSLALALIAFFFSNQLAFVFVMTAVIFFLTVTGIEIDKRQLKYRKYKVLIGFIKFGKWKSFSKEDTFFLVLSSESARFFSASFGIGFRFMPVNFYNGNKSKLTTFDVVCISKNREKIIVNDFLKYKLAKDALFSFQQSGCIVRNRIAEKIVENKNRRR